MKKIFKSITCLLFLFLVVFFTSSGMAATTLDNCVTNIEGVKRVYYCDLDFDSSYPEGGESVTIGDAGFSDVQKAIISPRMGYSFEYDFTNEKVKVYANAPAIIYDEKHTASITEEDSTKIGGVSQFYLDYPAAWIINIANDTGGGVTLWGSTGVTLVKQDTAYLPSNMADGDRTGISTYGTTDTVYVTYVTQAWDTLWRLVVQDELVNFSSVAGQTVFPSGNTIMNFGYAYQTGGSGYLVPVYGPEETVATGEIGIWLNGGVTDEGLGYSGITDVTTHADHAGDSAYFTYIKEPDVGTWIQKRFYVGVPVELAGQLASLENTANDVSGTTSTQISAIGGTTIFYNAGVANYFGALREPVLVWGVTGKAWEVGQLTHNIVKADCFGLSQEEVCFNWANIGFPATGTTPLATTAGFPNSGTTLTHVAYIAGYVDEIPNLVPLEVQNETDLSNLTDVQIILIGR